MVRLSLALALAASAAPAAAQDANQVNATEAPTTVVAGPDTAVNNNIVQPALPAVNETGSAQVSELDAVAEPAPQPRSRGDKGFPWGLIGLVGLVGLMGRARS